ncbi:MAG: glycerol-3-phosphate 1-O-acyltransferase PlsY [Deltaproteobacteria bacterium]|nr:glycerol-3-phosphate 1-O-acyltransferase PlsY [Deltaproteobacteria bacterium]
MISIWVPFSACAYFVGSIPFGKLIAKRAGGFDITTRGSGNIGATNVARELGFKWGLLTLTLDILKGFVPVFCFSYFSSPHSPGYNYEIAVVALSALLGHQFSLFQRFRGGKGVATALGIYLGISEFTLFSCLIGIIIFIITVYKWNFVSLGSLVSASIIPIMLLLFGESYVIVFMSGVITGLIYTKHNDNIIRLIKGEERKWRQVESTQ